VKFPRSRVAKEAVPVFECARCNALMYSASRAVGFACDQCGATTARCLVDETFRTVEEVTRKPGRGDHCVAVYRGPEEGAAVAAPFIEEGVRRAELTVVEADSALREAIAGRLGPGIEEAVEWADPAAVVGEGFDADRMAERLRRLASSTPSLRILGAFDAACALRVDALEMGRYERLAHDITVEEGVVALCLYDAELCGEGLLAAARATHPLCRRAGALRRNPEFAWTPAG
jgi:predicted RNA-binding Zn-ribbon protein involved in translation (DUF1610 family)